MRLSQTQSLTVVVVVVRLVEVSREGRHVNRTEISFILYNVIPGNICIYTRGLRRGGLTPACGSGHARNGREQAKSKT